MSYQWNASDYAQHSTGQERWARELLPLLALRADDHVLDIGCGDGRITASIAELVPQGRVIGIDSSAEMVAHASALSRNIPNVSFEQRDALDLRFTNEFTAIFSNAVLHWIRDQGRVVQEIARALQRGGRVLVQCGGAGNGQGVIDSFMRVASLEPWREYFEGFESSYGFYTDAQYAKWLATADLIADDVRLIPKDMVHANESAFSGWLRTAWHPYTSPVPEHLREQFIVAVNKDYVRTFSPDNDGCIHVAMVRLQFLAHKPK
jgi:trans-aconitate methyltransferase